MNASLSDKGRGRCMLTSQRRCSSRFRRCFRQQMNSPKTMAPIKPTDNQEDTGNGAGVVKEPARRVRSCEEGLGFATTCVNVTKLPSGWVEVDKKVTNGGAVDDGLPSLAMTDTKTGWFNVDSGGSVIVLVAVNDTVDE
ncbi:hypothetical protein MKEN_00813700 [Mycena kentingensis (nom. inval.)]|nr:hypothetical protein MKEN_00813700 [Mycena kentingensis (nom. inval.)]